MVFSLGLLFSCREPGSGGNHPCCFVVVANVFDHLIDNGMELKVYRKEIKESK